MRSRSLSKRFECKFEAEHLQTLNLMVFDSCPYAFFHLYRFARQESSIGFPQTNIYKYVTQNKSTNEKRKGGPYISLPP
jgi:hypothetical protein